MLKLLVLLISSYCYATDYSDALNKSKDAFLIQSGIQDNINKFLQYSQNKAKRYTDLLGISTEIGLIGYSYKTYKDKVIKIPLSCDKDLFLKPDSVIINIRF